MSTIEYLNKFHWLPVQKRIVFKILLIVHKCLVGKAPVSLARMLEFGGSTRTNQLSEARCNGRYGERSFAVAGPKIWNLLPLDIRLEEKTEDFKTKLKTFLFKNDIG